MKCSKTSRQLTHELIIIRHPTLSSKMAKMTFSKKREENICCYELQKQTIFCRDFLRAKFEFPDISHVQTEISAGPTSAL